MCTVRFIGCLHFGHKWMAQHRGYNDEFYHDEHLIACYNSVVNKRDLTYILGDITMETDKYYHQLDRLNGRKIVVLGNHDLPGHTKKLLEYVETVAGMIDYKGFCLTHAPIHPSEISFYNGNIHAHIHHKNKLPEIQVPYRYDEYIANHTLDKYYNVDAHLIYYIPKTLDELMKK